MICTSWPDWGNKILRIAVRHSVAVPLVGTNEPSVRNVAADSNLA